MLVRVANSLGLREHPVVCREHLDAGRLDLACRVTVKHEQSSLGARMLTSGGGERGLHGWIDDYDIGPRTMAE